MELEACVVGSVGLYTYLVYKAWKKLEEDKNIPVKNSRCCAYAHAFH